MEREVGNEILTVEDLSKTIDGVKLLNNISLRVNKGDKIAFIGDEIGITTLFNILMVKYKQIVEVINGDRPLLPHIS